MPISVSDVVNLQSAPSVMGGALLSAEKTSAFLMELVAPEVAPSPPVSATHAVLPRVPALPPAVLLAPLFIDITQAAEVSSVQTRPISSGCFDEVAQASEMPGVDQMAGRQFVSEFALSNPGPAVPSPAAHPHLRPVAEMTEHASFQPSQMETDVSSSHQHRQSSAASTAHPAHTALLPQEIPSQQEVTADTLPDLPAQNVTPEAVPLAIVPIDRHPPIDLERTSLLAVGADFASHHEGLLLIQETDNPDFLDQAVAASPSPPPPSTVETTEGFGAASGITASMDAHLPGPSSDPKPRPSERRLSAQDLSISHQNVGNETTVRRSPAPSDHPGISLLWTNPEAGFPVVPTHAAPQGHPSAALGYHMQVAVDRLSRQEHSLVHVRSRQVTIPPTIPGSAIGDVPLTRLEGTVADASTLSSQPNQVARPSMINPHPRAQVIVHVPSLSSSPPRQITAIEQLPIEAIRSKPLAQPGLQESTLRLRWVAYQPEAAAEVPPAVADKAMASTGLWSTTRFLTTQGSYSSSYRPLVATLGTALSHPDQPVTQKHGPALPHLPVQPASALVVSPHFPMGGTLGTTAQPPSDQMIAPESLPLPPDVRTPLGSPMSDLLHEPQSFFTVKVAATSTNASERASDFAKNPARRVQQPATSSTPQEESPPVTDVGAAPSASMARAGAESQLPSLDTNVVDPESQLNDSAPTTATQAPTQAVENERDPAPEPLRPATTPIAEAAPLQILSSPQANHLPLNVEPAAAPSPIQTPAAHTHSPAQQAGAALAFLPPDQPGRIELTLAPETLGRLHFDMRAEGTGLAITLSAERPETLDLMRRNLPELLAELKQAGVQAGTLSFGSWSEGRRAPTSDNPRPEPELATQPEAAPIPVLPQRRAPLAHPQGMDLRL